MKTIKLCMFDLDGTLIDSVPDLTASINNALKVNNLPLREKKEITRYLGKGLTNLINKSIPKNHYSVELFNSIKELHIAYYTEHCTDETMLYNGVAQMLDQLHSSGVKLAIVTNKPHVFLNKIVLDLFPGIEFFSVVGAGEYPNKPNPDSVLAVIKKAGVKKEDCLFVGDSDIDIQTAKNADINSVGVSWGYQSIDRLSKAGAKRIIKNPEELIRIIGC